MIKHLVLRKAGPGITPEQAAQALQALCGLKGRVPSIVEIAAGANFSERSTEASSM